MSCPVPEIPPRIQSPNYKILSHTYCVSQTLCERIKWKGKSRRNKLSKDYIGLPSNFKHLCHVGRNPQTGFATNLDPEQKIIFAQAGVTQDQLKDKRTSKRIFETIKQREAVLKEAKTKGLWAKSHHNLVPCSEDVTELVPGCNCKNELDCRTLSRKDGFEDRLAVTASISKLHGPLHTESPLAPPVSLISPSKKISQHNLILNMKEVQLKKAKSDQSSPLSQDVLMCQIGKGTQLKLVTQSSTSLQPSGARGIVAELKDVIQKRHEAIHGSDEESGSENGDEWAD